MGKVRTGLAVSLDGFISGPNDGAKHPWGLAASGSWRGTPVVTPVLGPERVAAVASQARIRFRAVA